MTKLIKHLKPFAFTILIIIGLLFIQATSDLSLPTYMSDIVNVGIQQNGINSSVPTVIRESEFKKITLFLTEKEATYVKTNYMLIYRDNLTPYDYKNYYQKYKLIKTERLYVLNTSNKAIIKELDKTMSKSILIVSQIESGRANLSDGKSLPEGVDPFTFLQSLPISQLEQIKTSINQKTKDLSPSIIKQSTIVYLKAEYKAVGVDLAQIQKDYITKIGLIMVAIAFVSMAASVSVGYIASRISAGLGMNLRQGLFTKVESFSTAELDKFGVASLITRTTNDIQQVQNLIVILLRIIFYAPILGIGGVLKVLATDTSMAWIVGVAIGAILIVVITLFIVVLPKFKVVQNLIDKLNLVARESLTGMLVIRAFNTEHHEETKFAQANKDLTDVNLFINRAMSIMFPLMMLIMNGFTILIVWIGAHQIDSGVIQVGDMMAFIQYTMQIIMAFLMITMVSIMLPRASVSATRIDEVLSTDLTILDPKKPKKFDTKTKGLVEFKNVSFKYPDAGDYVIKNINFTAKPGKTTAFIGSTGSGKSTIVNLIPRFYDVTEGDILIDGLNIKDVTQYDLRSKIGYVPQKAVLFSGTIASNLNYGSSRATSEELTIAAKISQSLDFINEKENNFEFEIAQGGSNVSGGQKQRLSIGRALVKKPEIYIFDDTFSALDFKTDANLRKALKKDIKGSTVLLVTQRISTIMNADEIIVLDDGKVVGNGTHDELMKTCKVYQEIALSQLSKEELA